MKQQTTALNTRRMSLFFYSRFSEKIGPPGLQKKFVKAPTLLLYLRVRWRPLGGISLLTEFGVVRLTVVMMTFPECTDVVLGRSRRDLGSVLLVARRMPLGDGVRDDFGRGGSHQSEVGITNRLSLNSLSLRYQIVSCVLQLSYQPVNFCNRHGSDFLNEGGDLRVSFRRRRKFCMSEIANFPFNSQICGYGLKARDVKFHKIPSMAEASFFERQVNGPSMMRDGTAFWGLSRDR